MLAALLHCARAALSCARPALCTAVSACGPATSLCRQATARHQCLLGCHGLARHSQQLCGAPRRPPWPPSAFLTRPTRGFSVHYFLRLGPSLVLVGPMSPHHAPRPRPFKPFALARRARQTEEEKCGAKVNLLRNAAEGKRRTQTGHDTSGPPRLPARPAPEQGTGNGGGGLDRAQQEARPLAQRGQCLFLGSAGRQWGVGLAN